MQGISVSINLTAAAWISDSTVSLWLQVLCLTHIRECQNTYITYMKAKKWWWICTLGCGLPYTQLFSSHPLLQSGTYCSLVPSQQVPQPEDSRPATAVIDNWEQNDHNDGRHICYDQHCYNSWVLRLILLHESGVCAVNMDKLRLEEFHGIFLLISLMKCCTYFSSETSKFGMRKQGSLYHNQFPSYSRIHRRNLGKVSDSQHLLTD